jgi:hypothetical protein
MPEARAAKRSRASSVGRKNQWATRDTKKPKGEKKPRERTERKIDLKGLYISCTATLKKRTLSTFVNNLL